MTTSLSPVMPSMLLIRLAGTAGSDVLTRRCLPLASTVTSAVWKRLLDLGRAALGLDEGAVGRHARDLQALGRQPRRHRVDRRLGGREAGPVLIGREVLAVLRVARRRHGERQRVRTGLVAQAELHLEADPRAAGHRGVVHGGASRRERAPAQPHHGGCGAGRTQPADGDDGHRQCRDAQTRSVTDEPSLSSWPHNPTSLAANVGHRRRERTIQRGESRNGSTARHRPCGSRRPGSRTVSVPRRATAA